MKIKRSGMAEEFLLKSNLPVIAGLDPAIHLLRGTLLEA
jgi:hypothetical protein